jgi:hypothetical protein
VKYTSKSEVADAPSIIRYVQSCTLRYATLIIFCFQQNINGCAYVNCTDLVQYQDEPNSNEFLELLKNDSVPWP